ncbi:MAG: GGDEF domain-containing protein, partial [Erythrobacter sp.]|nr:GGDEF domain-containing protein [Erythrobacter sp.]
ANIATAFGADASAMRIVAAASFLVGLAILSPALSLFHGRRPMWIAAIALVLVGVVYRVATLDAPRDALWYQVGFQLSFALPAALCALTVWLHAPATALNRALFAMLSLTSLHFPLKTIAAMQLGTGASEREFAHTIYAVVSQASSGLLLLGVGLLILISVLQTVVQSNHVEARHDPLTGLPNRRALQEAFEALVGAGRKGTRGGFVAIVDLDHFKRINDRLGHDVGDIVLRAIAGCLDQNRPAATSLARTGGEEFVLLLPDRSKGDAAAICETLRLAIAKLALSDTERVTASIGVSAIRMDESLADNLRRADQALYAAKRAGRDRCEFAEAESKPHLRLVGQAT